MFKKVCFLIMCSFIPSTLLADWPRIKPEKMAQAEAALAIKARKPAKVRADNGDMIDNPQTDAEFFTEYMDRWINEIVIEAHVEQKVEAEALRARQEAKDSGSVTETRAIEAIEVRP